MKTIKILHIVHSLQIGGLENGVVNLINHLDVDSFEHTVCCISTSGPMVARIRKRVAVHELNKANGRDYLLPLKLMKVIKKVRPTIVHTRNWGTIDGVFAARLAGVRHVIHGEHGREASDPTGGNRRRNAVRKILHPLVSQYITVSEDLKKWLVESVGIPERKIIQIINGVDAEKYKPDGNKKEARARIGIPQDVLVIGTVGRLDPVKDQRTLIKAFGLLTRARNKANLSKDLRLLIIGSGSNQRELKTVAHKEGVVDKVFFLGERNDVPELLQVMDVFVLPSIAEGISNTILEAMACGLPVIATTIGGNPEVIDDGKTGLLFKPGDHDRLAHLLARYCDDPFLRNNHGANGRARVEDNFSLSRMVREYDELYRTCGASFLQ